jgi:O-antigen biosynthesis protein
LLINSYGVPKDKILVAPFWYPEITDDHENSLPEFARRKNFVMLGNFRHAPNLDALRWCSSRLWKSIRHVLPEAELHVYGAYPTKEAKLLAKPEIGLFVHGPVDNVKSCLEKFRVNFAPLRYGAGVKGKITDGWFSGTPCLTSPIGAEGMADSDSSWGGLIASSESEFQQTAVKLYTDQNLWKSSQTTGFDILSRQFSQSFNAPVLGQEIVDKFKIMHLLRQNNHFGAILNYHLFKSSEYMSRFIGKCNELKSICTFH